MWRIPVQTLMKSCLGIEIGSGMQEMLIKQVVGSFRPNQPLPADVPAFASLRQSRG